MLTHALERAGWPQVKVEFAKALALRSEIQAGGVVDP